MIDFNNVPVPNRLMTRLTEWNKIGGKQMIINGAQPEWKSPIAPLLLQQMREPRQFKGNLIQEQEYQNQLNEELKNGIIKETNSIQVYNPTFIVPWKDGRLRKILNCRRINFFIKHVHFKMDGAEQLRQILQQSDYATILDIKDAFHHLHIQPNLQQFLGFQFKNKSYTYLGLPFGWNLSPFFFSKTLAIAIRAIRTKWKIKIQHYMDDIILIHHSKDTLKQTTLDVIRFLQNLGQRLSPKNINGSNNGTKQKKGDEEQTKDMDPNDKRQTNCDYQKPSISDWRNQLSSISIPSNITLDKLSEQPKNQGSSQRWMGSLSEVEQTNPGKSVNNPYLDLTKQTKTTEKSNHEHNPDDKRQRRWLGHNIGSFKRINIGRWPMGWFLTSSFQQLEKMCNITNLTKKSIKTLIDCKAKCILLMTDNTTTEFVIYKWKTASSILHLVREIFLLLNNLDMMIYTKHLPGLENSTADALSRLSWIGDYQINPVLLNEALQQINFQPKLDAFAHKTNKQLKRYCSPYEDNKTITRNALNIPWTSKLLLLHPPIGLIPTIIQKTIGDQVETVLILPRWCLYKYRTMLPPIQNQITLGQSDQVLIKGMAMKELQKLLPGIMEMVKINTKKESYYIENLQNQQSNKPDVELVNALAWYQKRGGQKLQQRKKKMKMYCGDVLSQFSQMNDINNSSLVKTYSKGQGLLIQSKLRFPTICNLQILFNYINTQTSTTPEEIYQIAMAMIVAFYAARMTELVFMKQSEMIDDIHSLSLKTQTSKGKQVIIHIITFEEHSGICCPVKTLRKLIQQINIDGIPEDQIWYNHTKNSPASSEYCSHQLTAINRRAGITSPYTGPTIRHAMTTRLSAAGATQTEVNAFTRHAIASDVVDIYYNKPVERDLASMLILNEKRIYDWPRVSVPYVQNVVELENLGEISTDEENEQDAQ
ncbi:MAG: putative reverse transcriptase [Streblomastix strix]|uniref:Putative reverse transcriptase n=1 Tax=Streblomastix strix TaxID=222440 RepID=A0A5J4VCM3_9EUKA|nr:MAG: putative reverse transcriptase [Streblomastix strix]